MSRAESCIIDLLDRRGPGRSICPSDAARALSSEGWRGLMDEVREAAARLADRGEIVITQRGRKLPSRGYKGPVRLAKAGGIPPTPRKP